MKKEYKSRNAARKKQLHVQMKISDSERKTHTYNITP